MPTSRQKLSDGSSRRRKSSSIAGGGKRLSLRSAYSTAALFGTGSVPGWTLDQFSYSEYDGYLRVATTEILTATGHHLRERSLQRQDFTIGRFANSSMIGRPDFDATLLLMPDVNEVGHRFAGQLASWTAP